MKRLILTMVALLTLTVAANAMSYKSARDQALFLTDKMAYELALTDDQYNACYEINLDYIMCIDVYDDLFGTYWSRRNTELSYVLTPAQYQRFISLEYFYRPISWVNKRFVFAIYDRYPKGRFFRAAPPGYEIYRGSNRYFDHSPYSGRAFGTPRDKSQPQPGGHMRPDKSQPQPRGGARPGMQPGGSMSKKEAINAGKQHMREHSGGGHRR